MKAKPWHVEVKPFHMLLQWTSLGHLPSGLVAKATYLVRRGGLRYQLIAKATYLRLRLRFILRSSGKRINAARLLEIGGPAKRLAQFLLV